jgi:hypothetical protein
MKSQVNSTFVQTLLLLLFPMLLALLRVSMFFAGLA